MATVTASGLPTIAPLISVSLCPRNTFLCLTYFETGSVLLHLQRHRPGRGRRERLHAHPAGPARWDRGRAGGRAGRRAATGAGRSLIPTTGKTLPDASARSLDRRPDSVTGTYSGSSGLRMLNRHLRQTSPSSRQGGIARISTFIARAVLLEQVIGSAVEQRRWVQSLQNDPAIIRLLSGHEPFLDLMNRLYSVLNGEDATTETRVRTAILSAAFGGAVVHPLVADLDDATLQAELVRTARRLFNLPDE